jgi:trehalose-6-phosphatase
MAEARQAAARWIDLGRPESIFRQHGGPRFFEVCPALAHKGQTVEWLLAHDPRPGGLPVYIGDDYNDEDAGQPKHGACNPGVTRAARQADMRLKIPRPGSS